MQGHALRCGRIARIRLRPLGLADEVQIVGIPVFRGAEHQVSFQVLVEPIRGCDVRLQSLFETRAQYGHNRSVELPRVSVTRLLPQR